MYILPLFFWLCDIILLKKIMSDPLEETFEVHKLSKKGYGLSSFKNKQLEIVGALPLEKVKAKILLKKRKKFIAKFLEVIEPSQDRKEVRCTHFGECGGCSLQHLNYEHQCKLKEEKLSQYYPDLELPKIIQSEPFHYRNKMEFSFSKDRNGKLYAGLHTPYGRGKIEDINLCHIAPNWFSYVLHSVKKWATNHEVEPYIFQKDQGTLQNLICRGSFHSPSKMVLLTVSGNAADALTHDKIYLFKKAVLSCFLEEEQKNVSIFLLIRQIQKGKETQIFEMHLHGPITLEEKLIVNNQEFSFIVSPQSFFQPNPKQAQKLYEKAIEMANLTRQDIVYDLYCGCGTIGICLANKVTHVYGIELSRYSALDAKENIRKNKIENYTLMQGDVVEQFLQLDKDLEGKKVAIVDPPRSGLGKKMITLLLESKVDKIIYISCNPSTQKEDIEELKKRFSIVAMQPIDQFPHTPHFENIAILGRC